MATNIGTIYVLSIAMYFLPNLLCQRENGFPLMHTKYLRYLTLINKSKYKKYLHLYYNILINKYFIVNAILKLFFEIFQLFVYDLLLNIYILFKNLSEHQ